MNIKVCYIITKADDIGGAQVHVRDLANLVNKNGGCAIVITGEEGELTRQLRELNINYKVIPNLKRNISLFDDIKAVFSIRKILLHFQPNIVSLHSSKAGIVGRLASIGLTGKVIFTAHGWAFANGVPKLKALIYIIIEKLFSALADSIITVSDQDRLLALEYGIASFEKITTIHNGMALPRNFRSSHADKGPLRLVMIARFCPQKDHLTLFRALSDLNDLDWTLDLIGSGPNEISARNAVAELGIESKVTFLGQIANAADYLVKYDIFLLISNWEGFPRSILEAMSVGLPVVASDVGGVRESVVDGKGGVLIGRGDVLALKNALILLSNNRDLRCSMGCFNQQKFLENFTLAVMYKKTSDLYLR